MLNTIKLGFAKYHLYVTLALAALSIGLGVTLTITELRLENCQTARRADIAEVKRASEEATRIASEEARKKEQEYALQAQEADARYRNISDQFRASIVRYQTDQRQAIRNDLSEITNAAERADGPDLHSGFYVTTDDAYICADNTARLISAREWALGLR